MAKQKLITTFLTKEMSMQGSITVKTRILFINCKH